MENVFLVAGLGNPGAQYARTRHNIGFLLVERFAAELAAGWVADKKSQARLAKVEFGGRRVWLSQPQTYMNASGQSVRSLADYYGIPPERILVAVDDADLPFGEIRLRTSGSSGGHHGLESVEEHLGTRDFLRLRMGIGRRDEARQISSYVLSAFERDEETKLNAILERGSLQIRCWIESGAVKAMSQFNGAVNKEEKGTEQ